MKHSFKQIAAFISFLFLLCTVKAQNWQFLGPQKLPAGHPTDYPINCGKNAGNGAIFNLAVEPQQPYNVFAAGSGSGIRSSVGNATSWSDKSAGFASHYFNGGMLFDAHANGGIHSLYIATEYGIFRSDNRGDTWVNTGFNPSGFFPTKNIANFYSDGDASGMGQYAVGSETTVANSTILGVVKTDFYHSKLYYFDPVNTTNVLLSDQNNFPFPSWQSQPLPSANIYYHKYEYAQIVAFPDNYTRSGGTKKFYMVVNEYKTNSSTGLLDPSGTKRVIEKIHFGILELTWNVNTNKHDFLWTDIGSNIISNIFVAASDISGCQIKTMQNPICSNYVVCFISGNDIADKHKMLLSTNNGQTWETLYGQFSQIWEFAVSEQLTATSKPKHIYFFYRDPAWVNDGWAYRCDDLYTPIPPNTTPPPPVFINYQSADCQYHTTGQLNNTRFHADQRAIATAFDGTNDILYIADDGGVAICTTASTASPAFTYLHNNQGLNAAHVNGISVSEDASILAAGFHHSSLNVYGTGLVQGNDWVNWQGGDGAEVVIDPDDKNRIFYSAFGDIQKPVITYEINAQTASNIKSDIFGVGANTYYAGATRPMHFDTKEETIYMGFHQILARKKTNNVWGNANIAISPLNAAKNIQDMYISPDATKMYVLYYELLYDGNPPVMKLLRNFNASGISTSTDWLSNNNGGYWEDITASCEVDHTIYPHNIMRYQWPAAIAVNAINHLTIYLAISSYTTHIPRVIKSVDGGNNWTDYSFNFPDIPIFKLTFDEMTNSLYAGTEAGVYQLEDVGAGSLWVNFNNPAQLNNTKTLPNCRITDMEINRNTHRLYIGAMGYGVAFTELACNAANANGYEQITTDQTWEDFNLNHNVVVQPSFTLTIKGRVYCSETAKFVVQPGGKLIIDGAKINATRGCSTTLWGGIQVNGTQGQPQTAAFQGIVELKNGAIIENAYFALSLQNGGMVKATDATFKNCMRAAEFLWYNGGSSQSYFNNCHFVCNEAIPGNNGDYTPHFITTNGIAGVQVLGCDFSNSATPPFAASYLGTGILAVDASLYVGNGETGVAKQLGPNPQCFTYGGLPSTFTNLTRGIDFIRNQDQWHLNASEAKFVNVAAPKNLSGVPITAQNPATLVYGCSFEWNSSFVTGQPSGHSVTTQNPPSSVLLSPGIAATGGFDNFYILKNKFELLPGTPTTGEYIICTLMDNTGTGAIGTATVFENEYKEDATLSQNSKFCPLWITGNNDALDLSCSNTYDGFGLDWFLLDGATLMTQGDGGKGCTNQFKTSHLNNIKWENNPNPTTEYFVKLNFQYQPVTSPTGYKNTNAVNNATCSPQDPCNIDNNGGGSGGEGLFVKPKASQPTLLNLWMAGDSAGLVSYIPTEQEKGLYEWMKAHKVNQPMSYEANAKLKGLAKASPEAKLWIKSIEASMNPGRVKQEPYALQKPMVTTNTLPGSIKLIPNPTTGLTELSYNLPKGIIADKLLIRDAEGKTMLEVTINGRKLIPLDVRNWPASTYFCSLLSNGVLVATGKLVVTK